MSVKKILLFILLFAAFFSVGYSESVCSKTYDEFIVQCSIPGHYFVQNYTCLNDDCSTVLRNNGYGLDLHDDEVFITTILRDNIPLNDLRNDLHLLNKICVEKFNARTLDNIKEKLDTFDQFRWKFLGGEKLTIMPDNEINEEKILTRYLENDRFLERCYNVEAEKVSSWLIPVKTQRPYCEIDYNQDQDCFTTNIQYHEFFIYLILNPSFQTIAYLVVVMVFVVTIILILDTLIFVHRNKKHNEFFLPNKEKAKLFAIIVLPYLYIYGIIVGYIINKRLLAVVSNSTEVIFATAGFLLLYFFICLYVYLRDNQNIKRNVLRKLGGAKIRKRKK